MSEFIKVNVWINKRSGSGNHTSTFKQVTELHVITLLLFSDTYTDNSLEIAFLYLNNGCGK